MKTLSPLLLAALILAGCGEKPGILPTSTASFDAKENQNLRAEISSLGPLDKTITIEGLPTSPFLIKVGVAAKADSAGGTSTAEILFDARDGKLSPAMDWQISGGGERPSLRRESAKEITVYYPEEIQGERTWVKFKIVQK